MVQSFYQSPFSSDKKTGLNGLVQYFWDQTAVQRCWTVRSSLFKRSPKKATVRSGPDRGQSTGDGGYCRTNARVDRGLCRADARAVFVGIR